MSATVEFTAGSAEAKMARLAARRLRDGASAQTDLEDDDQLGTRPENDARVAGIAADRLRSLVERIERLEDERKALGEDIADIYVEAKSAGFVPGVIRDLIRTRRKDRAEVDEHMALLSLYRDALDRA